MAKSIYLEDAQLPLRAALVTFTTSILQPTSGKSLLAPMLSTEEVGQDFKDHQTENSSMSHLVMPVDKPTMYIGTQWKAIPGPNSIIIQTILSQDL